MIHHLYTKDYLFDFCNKHHLDLQGDYDHVTRDTIITYICSKCQSVFTKNFRSTVQCPCSTCNRIHSKKTHCMNSFLEYCNKNQINIRPEQYHVTDNIEIMGPCLQCQDECARTMSRIRACGMYCKTCMNEIRLEKFKETNLQLYGTEFAMSCPEIQQRQKNTFIENYGVDNPRKNREIIEKLRQNLLNPVTQEKLKQRNLERYGVEYVSQSPEIKEKVKQTNLERYGVENAMQNKVIAKKLSDILKSPEVREKIIQTNLERYGVQHASQSPEVREKRIQTNLERYGVEHVSQSPEIKEKRTQTLLERYGVEHPSQNEQILEKVKQTNIERYGVEYVMQNAHIAERSLLKSRKLKEYKLPSGKIIKIQGYEKYALDILFNDFGLDEEDIITCRTEVPEIWYKGEDGKDHRYYVDIYIKSLDKGIEVKSNWTISKHVNTVQLKKQSAMTKLTSYEIWVINNKGIIEEVL